MIEEGFHGRENHGYILKSWVIHRGHGRPRASRMFRKLIESSHLPNRFPQGVLDKLAKGLPPRIAA